MVTRLRKLHDFSARERKRVQELISARLSEDLPVGEDWANSPRWRFLYAGINYAYCPFDHHWEFDGTVDGLSLPWSQRRLKAVEEGEELTARELKQWQRAMAKSAAIGDALAAFVVPLASVLESPRENGFAVFLGDPQGAAEDLPWLDGVYATIEAAESALERKGVLRRLP